MKLSSFSFLSLLLILSACTGENSEPEGPPPSDEPAYETPPTETGATVTVGPFVGSEIDGNFIYGAAMNLAWKDLSQSILQATLELNTEDATILALEEALNEAPFTKDDLNPEDYYIKSGYGQETVNLINEEVFEKFPDRTLPPLNLELNDNDIIAYAYFLKDVQYPQPFKAQEVEFQGEMVPGFAATERADREQVLVVSYESVDRFIIALVLEGAEDQLFLAKGYSRDELEDLLNQINASNPETWADISEGEVFEMPKVHVNHTHSYSELLGQYLAVEGFESYFISAMFENIRFDIDEFGARVENDATIVMPESAEEPLGEPRTFQLNDDFWIIMKEAQSDNPYFILEVTNATLLEQ